MLYRAQFQFNFNSIQFQFQFLWYRRSRVWTYLYLYFFYVVYGGDGCEFRTSKKRVRAVLQILSVRAENILEVLTRMTSTLNYRLIMANGYGLNRFSGQKVRSFIYIYMHDKTVRDYNLYSKVML